MHRSINKMTFFSPNCLEAAAAASPKAKMATSAKSRRRRKRKKTFSYSIPMPFSLNQYLLSLRSSNALVPPLLLLLLYSLFSPPTIAADFAIPGLYALDHLITPVQGQEQFEELVIHSNETKITLVQFYMATCPDCQGFSPYFKRFVSDVGPHWHNLMRILVVNCNDDLNINLCWRENPKLIVPLIRWYALPELLRDSRHSSSTNLTKGQHYQIPVELLSVAHRDYVEKQRRDLISLRRASLRFMASLINELRTSASQGNQNSLALYKKLSIASWHHLNPLGSELSTQALHQHLSIHLKERVRDCAILLGLSSDSSKQIVNFILFERRESYVGRTLVADWSNHTCSSTSTPFIVHYSTKWPLNNSTLDFSEIPKLYSITLPLNLLYNSTEVITAEFLANGLVPVPKSNWEHLVMRKKRESSTKRLDEIKARGIRPLDRLSQRRSLERFYSRRRTVKLPLKSPTTTYQTSKQLLSNSIQLAHRMKRDVVSNVNSSKLNSSSANSTSKNLFEAENINWAPLDLYPYEEEFRRSFNRDIAKLVLLDPTEHQQPAGLNLNQLGEIKSLKGMKNGTVVNPRDEDLSLTRLTDYYKLLDEIVHKNTLSKAQLDGYQLISVACLLRQLARHFPFQGAQSQHKSVARNYLELLQRELTLQLEKRLPDSHPFDTPTSLCMSPIKLSPSQQEKLTELRMPSKELIRLQNELKSKHDIGLPNDQHFKWAYCAGSDQYLRGHTCSLWLLFHTMTVHEYLQVGQQHHKKNSSQSSEATIKLPTDDNTLEEYKFVISKYSKFNSSSHSSSHRPCDPGNPEPALFNASSRELFTEATQYALANIINFVRYFLSCTNCAAHFSCMVERSPPNFDGSQRADDHLLWLWEAHNRVNLRTKGTHSEDPLHPKHVFPVYEACPDCYLEKPNQALPNDLDTLKFNRHELVKFLVARYQRKAILNNKIRIEDLFRKPVNTILSVESTTTTTFSPKM